MSAPYIHVNRTSTDWSHVHETINMLIIAICQIEATLTDSNESVDTLTQSFTELAQHTSDVSDQIQNVSQVSELDQFKQDIASTATEMTNNIGSSIKAFQFYDRVCQRLDHVTKSLEKVSRIMGDEKLIHSPDSWAQIQNEIKNSYTMEAEHIMFEYIMRGGSIQEALEIYNHHFTSKKDEDDNTDDEIELF